MIMDQTTTTKATEGITEDIFCMAKDLRALREEKERSTAELKKLNEDIKEKNEQLVKRMVDTELQKFSLDGTLFYLSTNTYITPIADKKEVFYAVLKDEGYGDLIQPSIPAPTLKAFVGELFTDNDDELPEWLVPYVSMYQEDEVKLRKEAKRKSKKEEEDI